MTPLFTPMLDFDNLPSDVMQVKVDVNRVFVTWGQHVGTFTDETHFRGFLMGISAVAFVDVVMETYVPITFERVALNFVEHDFAAKKETKANRTNRSGNKKLKLGRADKNRIHDARKRRKAKKKSKVQGASAV